MLIVNSSFKRLFVVLVFLIGCKTKKHTVKEASHLPLKVGGFYYCKNQEYSTDDYLLLKFYEKAYISELLVNEGLNKINNEAHNFTCILDKLSKFSEIFYLEKGDSIFFKKRAWGSYEFATLSFACKSHGDSLVARILPIDYYDTLSRKTNLTAKGYIRTFIFKPAVCDTLNSNKSSK